MLECFGFLIYFACKQPTPPPAIVACPQVRAWPADYQKRLAKETRALPPDAALRELLAEHVNLRDQARKCRER